MFSDRLQQVAARIEGIVALSLVARDGMLVDSVPPEPGIDLEVLAAELLTQVRSISQDHQELAVGQVRYFAVATDRMSVMVSSLSDEYFLLLVLKAGASEGRARFELRRAGLLFEKDIA